MAIRLIGILLTLLVGTSWAQVQQVAPPGTNVSNCTSGNAAPIANTALCASLVGPGETVNILSVLPQASPSTDFTSAINTLLATGKQVYFPYTGNCYVISSALTFYSNSALVGLPQFGTTLCSSATSGFVFNLNSSSVTSVRVTGLSFTSAGAGIGNITGPDFRIDTSTFTSMGTLFFNGATATGGYVTKSKFLSDLGTAIDLENGAYNVTVDENEFEAGVGFGIRGDTGAHDNLLTNNWTNGNGIELIGLTYQAYDFLVAGNKSKYTGDNCISISGYNNRVIGNRADHCRYTGIYFYGDSNTGTGNIVSDAGQAHNPASPYYNAGDNSTYAGITVSGNYGLWGQDDTITGNFLDDDQTSPTQAYGIKIGSGYTPWATSTTYAGGTYLSSGNNSYFSSAGGTSGATAPTCTSGTCSDGVITWTYISTTLQNTKEAAANVITGNHVLRYLTAPYADQTINHNNTVQTESYFNLTATDGSPVQVNQVTGGFAKKIGTLWTSGIVVTWGEFVYVNSGAHLYVVSNLGGTSTVMPTHTSGTVVEGDGISWTYIANTAFNTQIDIEAQYVQINAPLELMNGPALYAGTGTPSSIITANGGAAYLRQDGAAGATLYLHEASGSSTGSWDSVLTSASSVTAAAVTPGSGNGTALQFLQTNGSGTNTYAPTRQIMGFDDLTGVLTAATTYYCSIDGSSSCATGFANRQQLAPIGGTFKNLSVGVSGNVGAGNSYIFTVYVNGASTAVTCTIAGATQTACQDNTHTAAITANQTYALQIVTSTTATAVYEFGGAEFDNP